MSIHSKSDGEYCLQPLRHNTRLNSKLPAHGKTDCRSFVASRNWHVRQRTNVVTHDCDFALVSLRFTISPIVAPAPDPPVVAPPGCGYVKFLKEKCDSLGATGWVKNTKQSTICGKLQARKSQVDEMWVGRPSVAAEVVSSKWSTWFSHFGYLIDGKFWYFDIRIVWYFDMQFLRSLTTKWRCEINIVSIKAQGRLSWLSEAID